MHDFRGLVQRSNFFLGLTGRSVLIGPGNSIDCDERAAVCAGAAAVPLPHGAAQQ